MFLLVVLGEGYYTVQCERWQEELLWEIPDGRVSSEQLQCDEEETFLLVSQREAGCSYWLTQAGWVLQRERFEKFLMFVSVWNSYSAMKKKRSYWLAGKMRDVPIG